MGVDVETKPVDIYSEKSNFAIVRMPHRHYPGSVVQGDSLHLLWDLARVIAEGVRDGQTTSEEFMGAVEDLHNFLLDRLLHYQAVILKEGLTVPYHQPVDAKPVRLLGDEEEIL